MLSQEEIREMISKLESQLVSTEETTTEEITTEEITTNGALPDNTNITPGYNTEFEEKTSNSGVEINDILGQSIDLKLGSFQNQIDIVKSTIDKQNVILSGIMSRIELVEDIADKVTTVDTTELLTNSVTKLLM